MRANLRSPAPAATFRFGQFLFDSGSHQLLHGDEERHLSLKARQLLRLLLEARPRALSREELYDALWPSTFVCETNLASLVNEVRRALGDDARSSQYIRTIHSVGYAFCGTVLSSTALDRDAPVLMCEGQTHQLTLGKNTVGRAFDGRVVITDRTVSRHHAVITIDDEFSILDLGSKNGTYIDGERIGRAPVIVSPNAQIIFGAVEVTIKCRKLTSTQSLQLNMDELKKAVDRELGLR